MTTRSLLAPTALALAALAGCADMSAPQMGPTTRNTAIGAGVGGLAGAAIGHDAKGAAIGAGLGALGGYVWSQHMEQKKQAMQRATVGTGVAVTQTADNQLKLEIPSDISFDTGRADIKSNLRPVLDQFASGLSGQPNTELRIIGHTDSTGPDSVNDPLSQHRADAARDYLAARGVDPRRVATAGRGEHEPIADNNTEAGRSRNRRVEIFLGERANVASGAPAASPGIPAVQVR
ncbi:MULTISPECIES: OmpA family protein [Ramlibacter]|uniref:OmpA family protein n=1 Tax=Ramlibacter pinisoli TaxID=2682844 RepID=A0A6N8IN19_9BURK|nr:MULTISPECIES: OmpA family protein [Ramlibacter]MBA2963292.1 OmpA family protein [Ramlibacter sp. CGMCC 1.13660]MVQ28259.1 OmpA family protein [Ramlibacter pinisoli]